MESWQRHGPEEGKEKKKVFQPQRKEVFALFQTRMASLTHGRGALNSLQKLGRQHITSEPFRAVGLPCNSDSGAGLLGIVELIWGYSAGWLGDESDAVLSSFGRRTKLGWQESSWFDAW
jgi:hypothetical protein